MIKFQRRKLLSFVGKAPFDYLSYDQIEVPLLEFADEEALKDYLREVTQMESSIRDDSVFNEGGFCIGWIR